MSIEIEISPTMLEVIRNRHTVSVQYGLESVSQVNLQLAADLICNAILMKNHIFTIGNGASAAIAQHWACDFTKGCSKIEVESLLRENVMPRVISLAANIPLMTAISNDIDYNNVYAYQLERLADQTDVLITISSSGDSPNVIEAIKTAKKMGLYVIALTGFHGGRSKDLADISLHVDLHEYEATEDCHQALMHILAKYIRMRLW